MRPVHTEIVSRAREAGLADVAVLRGLDGHIGTSRRSSRGLLRRPDNVPVAVLIFDQEERLRKFLASLTGITEDCIVTLDTAEAYRYGNSQARTSGAVTAATPAERADQRPHGAHRAITAPAGARREPVREPRHVDDRTLVGAPADHTGVVGRPYGEGGKRPSTETSSTSTVRSAPGGVGASWLRSTWMPRVRSASSSRSVSARMHVHSTIPTR